jgi:hypothetical protein
MALSAGDRIYLIRVKIERAKKHLVYLDQEVIRFRDKKIQVVFSFSDADITPGKFSAQINSLKNARVLNFDVVCAAGDVVQNLRTALDHLANHLVAVAGNAPTRRTEFPIAKDTDTYEIEKTRKVKGMRPEAIKAIDRLKPYKNGNDLLWKIHELNNIDKHRMLLTVDNDCIMQDDWLPDGGYAVRAGNPTFAGVFDGEVEKNVEFEIDEAINQTQIAKGDALHPTLHQMIDFVEGLVLNFEPLLK